MAKKGRPLSVDDEHQIDEDLAALAAEIRNHLTSSIAAKTAETSRTADTTKSTATHWDKKKRAENKTSYQVQVRWEVLAEEPLLQVPELLDRFGSEKYAASHIFDGLAEELRGPGDEIGDIRRADLRAGCSWAFTRNHSGG